DFMGKTVKEVFKERPQILEDFERCYSTRKEIKREAPYTLVTTGETRFFVTTYNLVPPNLVVVYIEDITEYKLTEEALQMSEEQVDLICRYSSNFKVTFVNDAYSWYFNKNAEEVIGQTLPYVVKEDRKRLSTHLTSLNLENPVGVIEYQVVKPNGDKRWHRWINRAIISATGQTIEFRSVGRDITSDKAK
ncbi:MAG: PAS domain-containing protein, partial [Chloroflexota bacterium]